MISRIVLSNFKAFDEGPDIIELAPITLLYGQNSSGKSTILQALMVMKQSLATLRWDIRERIIPDLVPSGPDIDLFSFTSLSHKHRGAVPTKLGFEVCSDGYFAEHAKQSNEGRPIARSAVSLTYTSSEPGDPRDSGRCDCCDLRLGDKLRLSMDFQTIRSDPVVRELYRQFGAMSEAQTELYWAHLSHNEPHDLVAILAWFISRNPHLLFRGLSFHCNASSFYSEEIVVTCFDEQLQERAILSHKDLLWFATLLTEGIGSIKKDQPKPDEKPMHELALRLPQLFLMDSLSMASGSLHALSEATLKCPEIKWHKTIRNEFFTSMLDLTTHAMRSFAQEVLSDLFSELANITHLGASRLSPRRYSSLSNDFQYVGRDGSNLETCLLGDDLSPVSFVNDWMSKHEMPYSVDVEQKSIPNAIELASVLLRRAGEGEYTYRTLSDVGFGYCQLLPIITQLLINRYQIVVIEEPEIHIHPKLQAEVMDLFLNFLLASRCLVRKHENLSNIYTDTGLGTPLNEGPRQLIIETHSENLLLRLQRRLRNSTLQYSDTYKPIISSHDVSITYIDRNDGNTKLQIFTTLIPLLEDGEFSKRWPKGFFEERFQEETQ